jgi:hypothetical protein
MSEIGRQVKALFDLCMDLQPEQQIDCVASSDFSEEVKQKVLKLLKHQNNDLDISNQLLDVVKNKLTIDDLKPVIF